jgi:DNA-binding transcriptional ArsR family regulator
MDDREAVMTVTQPGTDSHGKQQGEGMQLQRRAILPAQIVELTAQRLRVMAEPKRIALLEALNNGEAGVQELADQVGLPHQNASHHLTLLWNAGLVCRRREANMTLYAVADWSAWWVVEQIARWVQSCQDEQGSADPAE